MSTIALYAPIIAVAFAVARPAWFGWWYAFILWLETTGGFGHFLSKPIGGCAECTAGFIALVWTAWTAPTDPAMIITNASAAILLAAIIEKAYAWTK